MKKLFLLLLTTFFLIGCSKDEDTIHDYIGTWSGTYDGTDKGDWNFVVSTDGKIIGTMHSETSKENYKISGRISNSGQVTADVGSPSDGQFIGTLAEDKGNGDWSNKLTTPANSGVWTGEKDKK